MERPMMITGDLPDDGGVIPRSSMAQVRSQSQLAFSARQQGPKRNGPSLGRGTRP
jgi:hypothetical protein